MINRRNFISALATLPFVNKLFALSSVIKKNETLQIPLCDSVFPTLLTTGEISNITTLKHYSIDKTLFESIIRKINEYPYPIPIPTNIEIVNFDD